MPHGSSRYWPPREYSPRAGVLRSRMVSGTHTTPGTKPVACVDAYVVQLEMMIARFVLVRSCDDIAIDPIHRRGAGAAVQES